MTLLANEPPVLEDIPEQITREGFSFVAIQLLPLVSDADHPFSELTWAVEGSEHIHLSLFGNRAFISLSDPEWSGTEVGRIEVCDPAGACAIQNVVFTVTSVNDPPVLLMSDQIVEAAEAFMPIPISELVSDVDHELAALTWNFSNSEQLFMEIGSQGLTILPSSSDWTGVETVAVTVCDPDGACDSREIQVARTVPEMLSITRVSVAGFMLRVGDTTVAIDALLTYGVSPATVPLLETATPPFDPDLILVTHSHFDHFSEYVTAAHMLANEEAILMGPLDVVDSVRRIEPSLDESRFVAIELGFGESTTIEVAGITIEAIEHPHSANRSSYNLGYIVHLGGYSVLHTGDLVLEALDDITNHALSGRAVDVALIPSYIMTSSRWHPFIHSIQAATFIPIHLSEGLLSSTCGVVRGFFENVRCFLTPSQTLFFDLK